MLLAHALLRRACCVLRSFCSPLDELCQAFVRQGQAILARRISMHVLMFIVLLGALYLQQFTEAATVAFLVNISEWIVGRSQQAVESELEKSMVGATDVIIAWLSCKLFVRFCNERTCHAINSFAKSRVSLSSGRRCQPRHSPFPAWWASYGRCLCEN